MIIDNNLYELSLLYPLIGRNTNKGLDRFFIDIKDYKEAIVEDKNFYITLRAYPDKYSLLYNVGRIKNNADLMETIKVYLEKCTLIKSLKVFNNGNSILAELKDKQGGNIYTLCIDLKQDGIVDVRISKCLDFVNVNLFTGRDDVYFGKLDIAEPVKSQVDKLISMLEYLHIYHTLGHVEEKEYRDTLKILTMYKKTLISILENNMFEQKDSEFLEDIYEKLMNDEGEVADIIGIEACFKLGEKISKAEILPLPKNLYNIFGEFNLLTGVPLDKVVELYREDPEVAERFLKEGIFFLETLSKIME